MGRNLTTCFIKYDLWSPIRIEYVIAVLTWGCFGIIFTKSQTSVAEVRVFIALYENIHLCQGKTIELYSIVWLCPINVLNMHGVQLYCLLCSKAYTVPQPTVQLHILYKIIIARVCSPCRFRTLMGPRHTIKNNSIVSPLQKWIFSYKAINNRTEATEVSNFRKLMKSLGGDKSLSGDKSFSGEKSFGGENFFLCIYFVF